MATDSHRKISDTAFSIDTARYLNDVELAKTLLENKKQNMIRIPFFDMPWMCAMPHAQAAEHYADVQQQ
jgi:hypothetical protein